MASACGMHATRAAWHCLVYARCSLLCARGSTLKFLTLKCGRWQALAALDERMHFLDCGAGFVSAGGASVNASMLPGDALHPNAAGYRVLAACLNPTITQIFATREAAAAAAGGRRAAPTASGSVLGDVDDAYAHTCDHPDTTSAEARAFAARMAAAAAPAAAQVAAAAAPAAAQVAATASPAAQAATAG